MVTEEKVAEHIRDTPKVAERSRSHVSTPLNVLVNIQLYNNLPNLRCGVIYNMQAHNAGTPPVSIGEKVAEHSKDILLRCLSVVVATFRSHSMFVSAT